MKISGTYRQPLVSAGLATIVLMVLGILIVDGGEALRLILIGMFVFWGWIALAIVRRPECPTEIDLAVIRLGVVPFVIFFIIVQYRVWHLRGLGY